METAGKSPRELISEEVGLRGASRLFRDAVLFADGKEIGKLRRKTASIGWDAISFDVHDCATGDYCRITVPRGQMEEYLALEAVGTPEKLLGEAETRGWRAKLDS